MKYPFQQLATTNARYAGELKHAAAEVIDSGRYLNGPQTEAFERELSKCLGVKHSIATGNGLDALKMIMRGYIELGRLSPGDELIAPANTFIATILPARELGLNVRLLEPDETSMCLRPSEAERQLTPATRMVAVTHLYGTPEWDDDAVARMRDKGIIVIEDNAQAIGATWHGRPAGSLGDASAISFYPAKNIGALGDAGAVSTNDDELAEVVRALHNYGADRTYHYLYDGYNSRMDEMQAAMLRVKLRDLNHVITRRTAAARVYSERISHSDITTPAWMPQTLQVWHQYVLRTQRRDALAAYLRDNGVGTLIHYPVPPHMQPCYRGHFGTSLPLTERLAAEVLSIPIADVSPQEAAEIADIINHFPN